MRQENAEIWTHRDSQENMQETLALLEILTLGNQEADSGRVNTVADVVARLRAKHPAAE